MRQKLIINDVHLGVQRNAGTTPKTAVALKAYLLGKLRDLMFKHLDKDIIFNGDVFDVFNVSLTDAFDFYLLCRDWLAASEGKLTLAEGNHDLSKNSANMCSLAFVVGALNSDRAELVEQAMIYPGDDIVILPHVANQDMFDLELEKASKFTGCLILLHANYNNGYAVLSDHSLNVSYEQTKLIADNNNIVIFGHVHQQSKPMKNVYVQGNQWPSSIADCLGNDSKQAFIFDPVSRSVNSEITWTAAESFAEINWDDLDKSEDREFVRVTGDCPSALAADMIAAISKYRQRSTSFVVTNAVRVAGVADIADLPSNLETVKGFDVLGYLFENLDDEQTAVVKGLMEKGATPINK